jgi:hypothetical protein
VAGPATGGWNVEAALSTGAPGLWNTGIIPLVLTPAREPFAVAEPPMVEVQRKLIQINKPSNVPR